MKYTFITFCILSLLSIGSSQKDLEFYSLEEASVLIEEETSFSYNYDCYNPIQFLCDILAQFDNRNNPKSSFVLQYTSVADLEKLHQYFLPYIENSAKFSFGKNSYHLVTDSRRQEEILQDSDSETWEAYLQRTYEIRYQWFARAALSKYSDGFIQIQDEYLQGWTGIKGYELNRTYSSFHTSNNASMTQQEATLILGGEARLVNTFDSLYSKQAQNITYENNENIPDRFFWVYADKAIGLTKKEHFKIVDASGQSLELLTDEVETQILDYTIAGIESFQIQIMFDLIPLDE